MRTPLASTGRLLEVACDESGYEGENLIGGTTDVFAHASVRLTTEVAANCVQEIRNLIRSPAQEYKSNHLLRSKHRPVLEWLLGPSGPIRGNAHVHLIDKTFFVVARLVDLVTGELTSTGLLEGRRARAMAVTLARGGPAAFGRQRWGTFLKSFNDLMRARNRQGEGTSVDSFFHMVDALRLAGTGSPVEGILGLLGQARPDADAVRARLLDNPKMIPVMDPLIPAILRAVAYWTRDGTPVALVHDQHTALTAERIAQLREILSAAPGSGLTDLRLVDSRWDSRVQVADFLAGIARRIASDERNDRGDAQLTELLRPYVDPLSIWADEWR
jgi:hypothetical protein